MFRHSGGHHQVVHSLREKLSTICNNKPKKNKKTQRTQKTKNKKKPKTKTKNRKLWCRDLEHLDSVYTYIISGNRILSVFFLFLVFLGSLVFFCFFEFFGFFGLLLHIVLNFSLKLCTTWWWPPLWPKHVVVSYLPPYSYIIVII